MKLFRSFDVQDFSTVLAKKNYANTWALKDADLQLELKTNNLQFTAQPVST